jgi:hypothetical protein
MIPPPVVAGCRLAVKVMSSVEPMVKSNDEPKVESIVEVMV